jgi:sorting nexin-8
VQEEFIGRTLPPTLEDSLPQNLQETFDTVRSGVRRSADLYINLCNLVERLCKRKEAIAAEYGRFGLNLTSITETTNDAFAIDTNDVPLLNEGVKATAKHLSTSQGLLEDEARAWDEGVLEDLKSVRDGMVALRDMFDRRDRLARDNIPQLEKRIYASENKLSGIKAKGDAAKPGEAEKVENSIVNVSLIDCACVCFGHICDGLLTLLAGQAIDRQPARARRLHPRVRARRNRVFPEHDLAHFTDAPGLGAGEG